MSFLILDLETNCHEYYGNLASPFHPENYIVAPGWALDAGDVQYEYFANRAEADSSDWFDRAISTATILVAHNSTFEIQWLLHRHYDAFTGFLKRGGRVYCTQLAEYLLQHQTETYPSLEDTAQRYGGTKKVDEVKLLWEQGALTSQIDKDLLIRYLAGPEGDIENTRKVCFGQWPKLEQQGMLQMFWERMDSLVFNAFCVFNGLHVDRAIADKNHKEQLAEADGIRQKIQELFPADMPAGLLEEFNFGSDYHMSAFLFGGPIKYPVRVSYDPIKYEKDDFYLFGEKYVPISTVDGASDDAIEELIKHYGNIDRYKAGKNKGQPKVHRMDTTVEKLKWGEAMYEFKGLLDFSALPSHVSEQYLGKRAEFRGKRTLCDDVTPVYSTGKDSLDLLATFTEVAKPLRDLAQLDKDNTYYLVTTYNKDGSIKKQTGMLQFVDDKDIIHHSLNGVSTITGRLSSTKPNLQNIPRDGTSKVKQMFTSRFGTDGCIVEVDYTALEVVTLAAISNDQNLLQKLLDGTDMHCYRLAGKSGKWQGLTYEELVAINNDKTHPRHHEVHEARTNIKPRAFAAQYGASAMGISFSTGCSLEEAEEFLANEEALFPQSFLYSKTVVRDAVESTGVLLYEQSDSGAWVGYKRGHFQAVGGTCYSFRQYSTWREGQEVLDYKDTQLANYFAQGEGSFIVQAACGRVIRGLLENNFFGGCVLPINTVHDAIYLDCINAEWAKYAGKMVEQIMASTPKDMCRTMPAYTEWRYDSTPFPAKSEYGSSMYDKQDC